MNVQVDGKTLIPAVDFMVDPSSGSSTKIWKQRPITAAEIFNAYENQKLYSSLKSNKEFNSVVIDVQNYKNDSLKKANALAYSLVELCDVMVITNEKFTFSVGREQYPNALLFVQGKAIDNMRQIETQIESVFKARHTARNVIAMLPAKKKTKETIVFSAHYDHLGGMGQNVYFPGGNDNASGTSMLLHLADYFKENPVPYNIVFMAFAGEEAGLVGSKYYTENPLFKLSDIKFLLNLDIMGSGEDGITVVNATLFPKQYEALVAINEQEKLLKQIKKRGPAANSDHYFFTEKGVPAFFIYTMGDNKHYHDVEDTYEALTFNEYLDITRLIAAFVKGL
ncbi:MAG: M20/M25/M40 family metallo-hydrolase [Crocinitomicaceae bacterium]|nr:MAG: M20/M25/M40 family metallo-hydrolase [Crocinitomicaceae bacterium]